LATFRKPLLLCTGDSRSYCPKVNVVITTRLSNAPTVRTFCFCPHSYVSTIFLLYSSLRISRHPRQCNDSFHLIIYYCRQYFFPLNSSQTDDLRQLIQPIIHTRVYQLQHVIASNGRDATQIGLLIITVGLLLRLRHLASSNNNPVIGRSPLVVVVPTKKLCQLYHLLVWKKTLIFHGPIGGGKLALLWTGSDHG